MEYGYLKLMTSQIDPVHFIKIENTYYTLSFTKSNKISFIKNYNMAKIELAYDNTSIENRIGPFCIKRERIDFNTLKNDCNHIKVHAFVIEDKKQIENFLKMSIENNFYYFPIDYLDQISLIAYKEL